MRTTLDIDDDVLAAAKELSRQQGCSAGQVVSALLRKALAGGEQLAEGRRAGLQPGVGGFRPFTGRPSLVTNSAIDALRDVEGV